MAEKSTSKNNKKPQDGTWTCKDCRYLNTKGTTACAGTIHTRLLRPVGRGMRATMTHEPCQGTK